MGYKKDAIRGISWMSGFRIVSRGMTFVKTIIIARVLSPSQFGIFGVATLVVSFLEVLTETGINIILIQAKEETDEYINSAWVVSIIRGALICLLIIVTAPFVGTFFHTPEAVNILLFISLVPLLRGFINPAEVRLQKDLKFHLEFWFRTTIFFFDALVSIAFAVTTHSVYSLVWGMIAGVILEIIFSFVLMRPLPRLLYHKKYFNEILHKGKWITIFGIFSYFAEQGDNIALGRVMGPTILGIYQMAYKLSTLPISEVTDVVGKVVFPVYTKIEGDRIRLQSAFIKSTMIITLLTCSMGLLIFYFPVQIVGLLLGDKWISMIPVLKILALYGVLRAISGSASALFLSVGKQKYVTGMTFFRFSGLVLTIYPFIRAFGMVGAGYSALFSVIIEIPVILYFIRNVFTRGR